MFNSILLLKDVDLAFCGQQWNNIGDTMREIEELTIEELREIVSVTFDSINDDKMTLAEVATDIGLVLIKHGLVKSVFIKD